MYNNIDCKSDIWLTGNAWDHDLGYDQILVYCTFGQPPAIDDFKNYADDVWFCYRYNVFMSYPHALKIARKTRRAILYNLR